MSNQELNPMQQQVVDVLGKPAGWVPLPITVVTAVREQLETALAPLAAKLSPDQPLYVSKGSLNTYKG